MVLATHQREREYGQVSDSLLASNKNALESYAWLFPEVKTAILHRKDRDRSSRPLDEGMRLIGFGEHAHLMFQALYDAEDREVETWETFEWGLRGRAQQGSGCFASICSPVTVPGFVPQRSYIKWLRHQTTKVGTRMHALQLYVRRKDEAKAAAISSLPKTTTVAPTASLSAAASIAEIPDDELLSASMELEAASTSQSATSRGPVPSQHSQPMSDPGKQPSQTLSVARREDTDRWYFMATEYLECRRCRKKVVGWLQYVLDQLHHTHRDEFPAILTYRLSCDKKLIGQMREHTLGNGANRLCRYILEKHTRSWMLRSKMYLFVLSKFITSGAEPSTSPIQPPRMTLVPGAKWLLSIYTREMASRLEETKARITSIFGSILKMNSTKKVTKKLAGAMAGTAAWVTNVGNEHGQILISVLTAAEGAGLHPMATGLMQRYRDASVSPSLVLYVDRDCCSHRGAIQGVPLIPPVGSASGAARRVSPRSATHYKASSWRVSYSVFLSGTRRDVARLRQTKAGEVGKGSRGSGFGNILLKELARHCGTCGVEETGWLIDEMLEASGDATDTMGIQDIWKTQRRHLHCIQDPPGMHLYMQTGQLPVFRFKFVGVIPPASEPLHTWHFGQHGPLSGLFSGRPGAVERGPCGTGSRGSRP
ncbi:uncharacterized protein LOC120540217 [Polypterus senegalus]|uniref:uncharacterized protein LOC120540217 n=1 Tax=Polypterus senegalus TaxID=55291 RepID=UPI0019654565|nr:uncharacterized protein LOC120540217 [Polypterus senegalus]